MVSEKTLNRVKACQDFMDQGHPLRKALLEAHVDIDTFKKYKELTIHNKDIKGLEYPDKVFKDTDNSDRRVKKGIGRPRKYEMKKIPQKITLEKKYVDKLKEEAAESGHPLAIVEADYIIEGLKKKYKDL
jgi:hypothetical protein